MAVINNPGLSELARQIVGEPGFSVQTSDGARAPLARWAEIATPEQRRGTADLLLIRWLQDEHADLMREQRPAGADGGRGLPAAQPFIAGALVGAHRDSAPEPPPPPALRFRSESPDWREPERRREPEREHADAAPPREPAERRGPFPVSVTRVSDRPVQQPSRKVAAYRQMFPELAFPVQTAEGSKLLAEFGPADIEFRVTELSARRQSLRTQNAGDEDRNDELARRIVKTQQRISERTRAIRDAQDEARRLEAAQHEMDERGLATIGELPADVLADCGFRRRVA